MSYIQIHFLTDANNAIFLDELLFAVGAHTVTLMDAEDEPIFEPALGVMTLWSKTMVTGLFDVNVDIEVLLTTINSELSSSQVTLKSIEHLEDKDWVRVWMDKFKPMRFGHGLWVVPTVYDAPAEAETILRLDPGLAFGTGTHPTTAMCLNWIDCADLRAKSVMDYGCGSGILGLAAIKKGAGDVIGVDIDPQALMATQGNLELNGLEKHRMTVYLPEECPKIAVDILVANILSGPLIELAPKLSELVKSSGQILLSGILAEQADDVLVAYSSYFKMEKIQHVEDWVALIGNK